MTLEDPVENLSQKLREELVVAASDWAQHKPTDPFVTSYRHIMAMMALMERLSSELTALKDERRERERIFVEVIGAYEFLRGYLDAKHHDPYPLPGEWLAEHKGVVDVEEVPESEDWRTRFWMADIDDAVFSEYVEALANGEQWAEESYEFNHPEVADG